MSCYICSECDKLVDGDYVNYMNHPKTDDDICEDCYENLDLECDVCFTGLAEQMDNDWDEFMVNGQLLCGHCQLAAIVTTSLGKGEES